MSHISQLQLCFCNCLSCDFFCHNCHFISPSCDFMSHNVTISHNCGFNCPNYDFFIVPTLYLTICLISHNCNLQLLFFQLMFCFTIVIVWLYILKLWHFISQCVLYLSIGTLFHTIATYSDFLSSYLISKYDFISCMRLHLTIVAFIFNYCDFYLSILTLNLVFL